ncbi:MAG: hypothetical protein JWP97_1121 [Labilithrix sp.]|nr:hypothetical protein [Labilithrix sp.]
MRSGRVGGRRDLTPPRGRDNCDPRALPHLLAEPDGA